MANANTASRRLPAVARAAMRFQVFLLRNNMMGSLGNEIMVITTTGRKSGKRFSTPIAFLPDGRDVIGLNAGGASNWYKNVFANPAVELVIRGKAIAARAIPVEDEAERRRIFDRYRSERRQAFPRLFGVTADAPTEQLDQALRTRLFVRFVPA